MDSFKNILIFKILSKYRSMRETYAHQGFFYFESNISKIDRIGNGFLYNHEEIPPLDWRKLKGKELYKVYRELSNRNFYFYKNINGKFYKTRPKKLDKIKLHI